MAIQEAIDASIVKLVERLPHADNLESIRIHKRIAELEELKANDIT